MLALNDEGVESSRLDPNRDQFVITETDVATRFRDHRNADGNLLPRPACRAGVPCGPGAFGHGLAHAQQGHDVSQRPHRPRMVRDSEQRPDTSPHLLCVVLPAPFEQPCVSEPRIDVRDEDVLDRDLELRNGVVVERDVQPLAQLSLARLPVAPASKSGQMDQRFDPSGRRVILGPGQQSGQRRGHQGEAEFLETPHQSGKARGHASDVAQLTACGARHQRRGSLAV